MVNHTISSIIKDIKARKVIDARGQFTIEVDVITERGFGRSTAPMGAAESRSEWEAQAYPSGGIDEAIQKVKNQIAPKLVGIDAKKQELIDKTLKEIDGTYNFSNIGGNTSTVISISVAKAAAFTLNMPLYRYLGKSSKLELSIPIANIIGGGPHAQRGRAPDMQEHHVIPIGAKSMLDAVSAVVKAHQMARSLCDKKDTEFGGRTDYESAWIPRITDTEGLDILVQVCEIVGNETGIDLRLGIDVAATSLWDPKEQVYMYKRECIERDRGEQFEFISELIKTYPLYYVEDAFHSSDYDSFMKLTKRYGSSCLICGDDLFSCSPERLLKGVSMGAGNANIIKVNMIGTLTDAYKTVELAHKSRYVPVQSRRSVETEDTAIAHLAVAWNCPFNKFAIAGEGAAKLNELLRIEEELGPQSKMPSLQIHPRGLRHLL